MKKSLKILLMIGTFGLVGCTTDVTEDVSVAPVGDQVSLSVSISQDVVRTELGEKSAEGKYPLYWSDGDAVSVNGASATVAINADDATSGAITTTATAPYNVVYPYVEGLGASQARFLDVQAHTAGTFAPQSAPMYGYAESAGAGITLRHLTGILRFSLTSAEGYTLSNVVLTAEQPIAGDFTIDCTTGEKTAIDGATSNSLTYTFAEGEGLLSATATEFFVAVPAGSYENLEVLISTTTGESMIAKFNASDIKAGVVREFAPAEFVNNGNMFLIYDEATLAEFASLVAAGTFTHDAARVIRSFEVSADFASAWTPIEGFALALDGNSKTISGMTKPLFGTTTGTLRNVVLKGNYTVAAGATFGALVQTASDGAVIDGCSLAEGSTVTVAGDAAGDANVGGLVGEAATTASIANSTNGAAMTVSLTNAEANLNLGGVVGLASCNITECINKGAVSAVGATLNTCNMGGLIGHMSLTAGSPYTINGCENEGAILVDAESVANTLLIGGIVGSDTITSTVADLCTIKESVNKGSITYEGTIAANTGVYLKIGGIAGYSGHHILNCENGVEGDTNVGKIYVSGAVAFSTAGTYIGGIVGLHGEYKVSIENDILYGINYAAISIDGINQHSAESIFAGGIAGGKYNTDDEGRLNYSENNGPIYFKAAAACAHNVGGISASAYSRAYVDENNADIEVFVQETSNLRVSGCFANKTVKRAYDITNNGDITIAGVEGYSGHISAGSCIGGCVGYATQSIQAYRNTNAAANHGDITIKGIDGVDGGKPYIGGTIGYSTSGANNVCLTNTGNLLMKDCSFLETTLFGGVVGQSESPLVGDEGVYDGSSDYVSNSGNVTVENSSIAGNFYVSGILGYDVSSCAHRGLKNTGRIYIDSKTKVVGNSYVAGLFGYLQATLKEASANKVSNNVNEGAIYANLNNTGRLYVAGIVAYAVENTATKYAPFIEYACNKGDLNLNIDPETGAAAPAQAVTSYLYVSGISSGHNRASCGNFDNQGDITIGENLVHTGTQFYVSGVCAYVNKSLSIGYIQNSGNITVNCTTSAGVVNIAGCTGRTVSAGHKAAFLNTGNITVGGKHVKDSNTSGMCVGGCIAYYSGGYGNYAHTNSGNISVSTDAQVSIFVGGVVGYNGRSNAANYLGLHSNSGLVSFTGKTTYDIFVGGIIGAGNGRGDAYATNKFYVKSSTNSGAVVVANATCRHAFVGSLGGFVDGPDDGTNTATDDVRLIEASSTISGDAYFNIEGSKLYGLNAEYTDADGNITVPGTVNIDW